MKRLYRPIEKDQIIYEMEEAQAEIKRLKEKPCLSEMEFRSLQMAQQKYYQLRRIVNAN